MFHQHIVHRHIRCGPVVLGPVKLDAAADPGTEQPHQRRFDHMIIIHKVITVGLIIGSLNPSPQFWQDHDLQIFIFQIDRPVRLILLIVIYFFDHGIRIYPAAAALIYPLFQKHRVFIRFPNFISRNRHNLFPYLYCFHFLHSKPPLNIFFLLLPKPVFIIP